MIHSPRVPGMRSALAMLVVSAALQFACFARWPGNPERDVYHSIFAAENFVLHGQLKSINPLADYGDDLAQSTRPRWMMHWPPGHSLLYVAVMSLRLSAGPGTKLLGLLCVVAGGVGWIYLARGLGASGSCIAALAAAYPWLPFQGNLYINYSNEHPALALVPWICFALLQIEPLNESSRERWDRLLIAAFLAGAAVLVKYSLAPVLFAAVLYLLWLDGAVLDRRRVLRVGAFSGFLVLTGLVPWLISRAYGERYPLPRRAGRVLSLPEYVSSILSNSVSGPSGWDRILMHLNLVLDKKFHVQLALAPILFVSSLALLAIWCLHFKRFPWRAREKSFGVLLLLLTVTLWMMLGLMTNLVGMLWDFTANGRLYIPITLLWLLSCGVSLGKMERKDLFRSTAFYTLAVPFAVTAAFYAATGLIGRPYECMPNSDLAWTTSDDINHASFLSNLAAERGRKPNLLIAEPRDMAELGVPYLYLEKAVQNSRRYWSSVNMEVWAIIEPAKEKALLANFRRASSIERIKIPARFPFVVYIFRFNAEGNAQCDDAGDSQHIA